MDSVNTTDGTYGILYATNPVTGTPGPIFQHGWTQPNVNVAILNLEGAYYESGLQHSKAAFKSCVVIIQAHRGSNVFKRIQVYVS